MVDPSDLKRNGYAVLPGLLRSSEINEYRRAVCANLHLMGQTRSMSHSRHLAGFHRFPKLSLFHHELASHPQIVAFLTGYFRTDAFYAIGLSDITVNRSQEWHTDLLRGKYSRFLDGCRVWDENEPGCIKALVYLQSGRSLRIVPGSHRKETPLDDQVLARLAQDGDVVQLDVSAGDVVMMDIRCLHRGSTEEEMQAPGLAESPKILISTVFGAINSDLTHAMQVGNVHRNSDWDLRFLKKESNVSPQRTHDLDSSR